MKIFSSFNQEVIKMLQEGAVGVIPTDTLYGIVADLFNPQAVQRIYSLKGREGSQAVGTILINDSVQIQHITDEGHLKLAQKHWPGPESVIIPVDETLWYAHGGYDALPFRVPDYVQLREVLSETGPIASSSANRTSEPPANTMQEALSIFREGVDFYVDGGDLSHRKSSRIISYNQNGEVEVTRS